MRRQVNFILTCVAAVCASSAAAQDQVLRSSDETILRPSDATPPSTAVGDGIPIEMRGAVPLSESSPDTDSSIQTAKALNGAVGDAYSLLAGELASRFSGKAAAPTFATGGRGEPGAISSSPTASSVSKDQLTTVTASEKGQCIEQVYVRSTEVAGSGYVCVRRAK